MGRERDNLEDEGTWHQPLPGPASPRPHDQPTARDARPEDDDEDLATPMPAPAPAVTSVERTSPAADVARAATAPAPSGVKTAGSDPRREREHLEDEGTWHQPLVGHGSARPYDQPTARDAMPEDDDITPTPAPAVTSVERTSPAADVSLAQRTPSGGDTSESDPQRTQPHSREGSAEWDALPAPVLQVGQVAFGKYRLIEKIGEGGMGEVWRVWHLNLEAERALKLIKPELAQNDKGWRRFQREARLMAKINHPNNVAVNDFGRAQSVGYIEMEYVRGRSLTEVLKDNGEKPMSVEWTAQILDQLCEVLQEAHGHTDEKTGEPRPIIHRDLKPSNLMLVERKGDTGPPRLKVLDFGIAKIAEDEGSPELTGAGDLVGTPAFMSPEQIRGGFEKDGDSRDIDGRSDLYSTGVMLYQLLTGALPFRGSKMSLLAAHLNNAPLPMKEANPKVEVPPAIEQVVLRCLEKDPAKRPQTARELAEEFRRAAGLGDAAPRRPVAGPSGTRRTAALAGAAVVLAACVGLGTMMIPRPPKVSSGNGNGGGPGSGHVEPPPPPPPVEPVLWEPDGYAAVDPSAIVPDHSGFPMRLKRKDGDAQFVFFSDRVYLPDGYEPESLENLEGALGWPKAIIRKEDKVRFIRIQGAVFLRGDPNRNLPSSDAQGSPLKPHYVRVGDFYIQETEVTNGEIERFARAHPDEAGLGKWRDLVARFRDEHPDVDVAKYPATCVDYRPARKYALSVGGLLPTESEWEFAAKSRHEEYSFAWGANPTPPGDKPRAWLENPDDEAPVGPVAVMTYKDTDRTLQGVLNMVGNVRELCADAYIPYTKLPLSANSPTNPLVDERKPVDVDAKGIKVVVRGGSFQTSEAKARAFYRKADPPVDILDDIGFRVVIECPSDPGKSP